MKGISTRCNTYCLRNTDVPGYLPLEFRDLWTENVLATCENFRKNLQYLIFNILELNLQIEHGNRLPFFTNLFHPFLLIISVMSSTNFSASLPSTADTFGLFLSFTHRTKSSNSSLSGSFEKSILSVTTFAPTAFICLTGEETRLSMISAS